MYKVGLVRPYKINPEGGKDPNGSPQKPDGSNSEYPNDGAYVEDCIDISPHILSEVGIVYMICARSSKYEIYNERSYNIVSN